MSLNTDLSFPLSLNAEPVNANQIAVQADFSQETLIVLSDPAAATIKITSVEELNHAVGEASKIKTVQKTIEEKRKELTAPLDAEKQRIMEYVKPYLTALSSAEGIFKKAIAEYHQREEQARLQAAAKAEEQARLQREKLEEKADKLESSGKEERADALRVAAASTVAIAPVTTAPPKAKGSSVRTVYSAVVKDTTALAEAALARHLLESCDFDGNELIKRLQKLAMKGVPLQAITADEKFLNQQAKAMKDAMDYPGVKVHSEASVSIRSKA